MALSIERKAMNTTASRPLTINILFRDSWSDRDDYIKGAGQSNESRNSIIPSYLKDVASNRLLLRIWNQALDALANASELIRTCELPAG